MTGHIHPFRHTFISNAPLRDLPVVRDWVGHVDREVIRQYTHVADVISRESMDRLSEKNEESRDASKAAGSDSVQSQHTDGESA